LIGKFQIFLASLGRVGLRYGCQHWADWRVYASLAVVGAGQWWSAPRRCPGTASCCRKPRVWRRRDEWARSHARRLARTGRLTARGRAQRLTGAPAADRAASWPASVPFAGMYRKSGRAGRRYVIDDYEIAYAPSATLHHICKERSADKTVRRILTAVGNPTEDLPFSPLEIERIVAPFAKTDRRVLLAKQASARELRALATNCFLADPAARYRLAWDRFAQQAGGTDALVPRLAA
jgi:hypothetical protein